MGKLLEKRILFPRIHFFKNRSKPINSVPNSTTESVVKLPPCAFTISWVILSPSPVPSVPSLLVKKGGKILSLMASGMPGAMPETLI
jgi:hypothetical protein